MRKITETTQFKRDYKKIASSGRYSKKEFLTVVELLALDEILSPKFRDHALTGDWKDHRDCHIKPDLVLIYKKPDENTLELVRLGSHSKLGL